MKIFSGTANRPLAEKISRHINMPLGTVEINRFSDGEIGVQYTENIRGTDVFIIQPTCPPCSNLMELLLLIDAARRASAKRITAVIPYFGYARQDRKDQPRVSIAAKLVANLISTAGADRVLTIDLHSASIQGFFDIPFDHLYSFGIFTDYIEAREFERPVVVAPDIGSSKRARAYANRLCADLALVDKKRLGPNKIDTVTLIGDVTDRQVILVDDIVDTAGTLCRAADLLFESGASAVFAAITHPLLSGNAVENIENSRLSRVIVSNTIQIPEDRQSHKIEVISSHAILGEAIRRIHNEESISSLFHG